MVSSKELKERVSEVYAERIQGASSCCDDGVAVEIYSADALEGCRMEWLRSGAGIRWRWRV